eukprot:CAMPEP_0202467378 /NCGR_PEP_ID=MMETSP1360-20130828/71758_1 /ASSEMBLY_ACC=CAM_ASM_000848 /TAXON_ID=515479 /ORGANISM="Licmophora paradoxa, Strain CCMP2313" /LENGTH=131 /DNA_ID=CAMNT_0049091893 /DNA_START=424 /DNA_END=817 /DNA_ORIENTATION=-
MARSVPQSSTQKRIKRGGSSGVGSVRVTGMEESYHRLVTINNNNPLVSAAPEEQGNSRSEVDMFNCSQESLLTKSNSRDGSGSLLTSLHTLGEERISTKTFAKKKAASSKMRTQAGKETKRKKRLVTQEHS